MRTEEIDMFKLCIGIGVAIITGLFLGWALPIEFFLIAALALIGLVVLLFLLFHLGLRDFQGY